MDKTWSSTKLILLDKKIFSHILGYYDSFFCKYREVDLERYMNIINFYSVILSSSFIFLDVKYKFKEIKKNINNKFYVCNFVILFISLFTFYCWVNEFKHLQVQPYKLDQTKLKILIWILNKLLIFFSNFFNL